MKVTTASPTSLPKDDGTAGELICDTKTPSSSSDYCWKGWYWQKSSLMPDNSLKKPYEFATAPSNLTGLMWPMTVDQPLRQNMVSGILDTVAWPTWHVRTKTWLSRLKSLRQSKGRMPMKSTACSCFDRFSCWKTSRMFTFLRYGNLEALLLAWVLKWLLCAPLKSLASIQDDVRPWFHLGDQVFWFPLVKYTPWRLYFYDIPETYVAELNLQLLKLLSQLQPLWKSPNPVPVSRDIALLLSRSDSPRGGRCHPSCRRNALTDIKPLTSSGEKLGIVEWSPCI